MIEVFGRYAGFTALLPTMAGAANRCVIPEHPFDIEDLLELSRIEQEAQLSKVTLKPGSLEDVLQAAVEACHARAEARNVRIDLECEQRISAELNAALLEQAVVNLLDNAIKYSEQ